MTRVERTVEQDLERLQEKRTKVLRQVVESSLSENPRFQAMKDVYKKINRYDKEAENLLDEDKYNVRKQAILDRLDDLEQRRTIAEEARAELSELRAVHLSAQEELANALISLLDSGEVPADFEARINDMLDNIDVDSLTTEPSDPFAEYRKKSDD